MDDNTSTSAGSLEGTVGGVELGGGEGGRVYESGLMRKIKGGGGRLLEQKVGCKRERHKRGRASSLRPPHWLSSRLSNILNDCSWQGNCSTSANNQLKHIDGGSKESTSWYQVRTLEP